MIKKIICIILCLFVLCSCAKTETPEYTYEIKSTAVDMSAYTGVTSTNHNFREITLNELLNVIDNKSSGVFFIGFSLCNCCQRVTRYLNEVAQELNVTVYYIDAYNEETPLTEKKNQEILYEYLGDIISLDENGQKILLTPHVFSIINGKPIGSQICFDNFDIDASEDQLNKFKDAYRKILKPFAKD